MKGNQPDKNVKGKYDFPDIADAFYFRLLCSEHARAYLLIFVTSLCGGKNWLKPPHPRTAFSLSKKTILSHSVSLECFIFFILFLFLCLKLTQFVAACSPYLDPTETCQNFKHFFIFSWTNSTNPSLAQRVNVDFLLFDL